jgi:hypothetical protein
MKQHIPNQHTGITQFIMRYRKIWLPVASAGGILFFCFCDYVNHPDVAIVVTATWLYYAIFLITTYTSVSVCKDHNGDLIIVDKKENEENSTNKNEDENTESNN